MDDVLGRLSERGAWQPLPPALGPKAQDVTGEWTPLSPDAGGVMTYAGAGHWQCAGCAAVFVADHLPPLVRRWEGTPLWRPLCAHCAEGPPGAGDHEMHLRGHVVRWTPLVEGAKGDGGEQT